MKKIFLTVTLILWALILLGKQFSILEFRELPADFTGQRERVTDMDMKYCSVLKVESVEAIDVSLLQKTYRKDRISPGNYYLFFSAAENVVTLQASGYESLDIQAPKRGFEPGMVYYLRVKTINEIPVVFNVTPKDAELKVDGIKWDKHNGMLLPGNYFVEITKDGYQKASDTIEVTASKNNFAYTLGEIKIEEKTVYVEKDVVTSAAVPTMNIYDYSVKLVSCTASPNNTVTAILMLTNLAESDRDLTLKGETRIYDNQGREFGISNRTIGGKNQSYRWYHLQHKMIRNVPVQLKLEFNEVPASATSISLMEIDTHHGKIPFRNIIIERN